MTVKISSIGLRTRGLSRASGGTNFPRTESMVIVGLPDASVKESKERVLSAVRTLDCDVTNQKIVVNLSPSEQKKNGPLFDLVMAIGVLMERNVVKEEVPRDTTLIGALSLDGSVVKVEGMLPALIAANALGFKQVFFPMIHLFHLTCLRKLSASSFSISMMYSNICGDKPPCTSIS